MANYLKLIPGLFVVSHLHRFANVDAEYNVEDWCRKNNATWHLVYNKTWLVRLMLCLFNKQPKGNVIGITILPAESQTMFILGHPNQDCLKIKEIDSSVYIK